MLVPESGQGAFGPALVTVSHAYADYRNHPLFTIRMERFLDVLLQRPVRFVFPRLWYTKGETLRAFTDLPDSDSRARNQILLAKRPVGRAKRQAHAVRCLRRLYAEAHECPCRRPRGAPRRLYLY